MFSGRVAVAESEERNTELVFEAREAPAEEDLCTCTCAIDEDIIRATPLDVPLAMPRDDDAPGMVDALLGDRVGPALDGRGACKGEDDLV